MRSFSASFSSRARRAMSLTASNSSRLTISRSRRIFLAWLRTTVSTSRFTPWAAPAASFIRRPDSSKKRVLVWVIAKPPLRLLENSDPRHTVQERLTADDASFRLPFICNRDKRASPPTNRAGKKHHMIDQQIDIQTKDGKTTTFISHPERG